MTSKHELLREVESSIENYTRQRGNPSQSESWIDPTLHRRQPGRHPVRDRYGSQTAGKQQSAR